MTGGVSRYIDELSLGLTERGCEVFTFGCSGPGGSPRRPTFVNFAATRRPGDLLRMIHNPEAERLLDRFLSVQPIDVAHLHNIYHHLTPSILPVLRRRGAGVVMTVHDYRLLCPTRHFLRPAGRCMRCVPNRFFHAASTGCRGLSGAALAIESTLQRLARRYIRGVDLFLCPTRYMAALLRQSGVPRNKLHVLPNLVRKWTSLPEPAAEPTILYAGRLSEEKAPGLCLGIAEKFPEARVIFAGTGPAQPHLRQRIDERGLTNVVMTGQLLPGGLGRLFGRAWLVVVPSVAMENSPASMLEGMSAGRCVLVPDQPPLREFVIDGETGRTFRSGDAGDFVDVAGEILQNPSERHRQGAAAKDFIRRHHDRQTLLDETLRVYDFARPI